MSLRWGIVGCGDVTEVKSGPALYKARDSELVAVMRRDGAKSKDFARRHQVARHYDDAEALINDRNVDIVYVATPPGSHLELAQQVAAAGKPCYMEKPMARSAAECHQMIKAFKRAKRPLYVAYYRRRLSRFECVRKFLAEGWLGAIRSVSFVCHQPPPAGLTPENAPWRLQAEQSGGGLFLDLGCHALDLLDHWFGPLKNVTGEASRVGKVLPVEDKVSMQWELKNGAEGSAEFSFTSRDKAMDEFKIVGAEATLKLPCFAEGPLRILRSGRKTVELEIPHPAHVHQPLAQSIVDELRGRGKCPSVAESALRTNEVMDAVLNKFYCERDDKFWNRPLSWRNGQSD